MDDHEPVEPFALLRWNAQSGFEVDMTAVADDAIVRLVGVPVPADGLVSLGRGVGLYALDILFKAHVDWNGAPCQMRSGGLRLVEDEAGAMLVLEGELEDPDSGDIKRFSAEAPVDVPAAAPDAGGPVPIAQTEDDLDWEDETTIETLLGDVDAPIHTESRRRRDLVAEVDDDEEDDGPAPKGIESMGLKRLLAALTRPGAAGSVPEGDDLDDLDGPGADEEDDFEDDFDEPDDLDDAAADGAAPRAMKAQLDPLEREAYDFLRLLVDNDHLELCDGFDVDSLVKGVTPVLASRAASESKAAKLSAWLIEQPAVDELFLDDEELAELLEQW